MRIGSLCSGYGGLDLATEAVFGGGLVWVADNDPGAAKILAHRYPTTPNLGDLTRIDWTRVEPIDILTAGFPCQPVSHAGKRLGDEDERWLWDDVARAVRELRPKHVVLENVRGLLTAGSGRLFGRVLGSLAGLGYDAEWHGLRAADVGAPHGRWRIFVVATDTERGGRDGWARDSLGREVGGIAAARGSEGTLLPTPRSSDTNGPGAHGDGGLDLRTAVSLMPTPRAPDGTNGGPNQRGSSGDLMLPSAVALLGTPTARDWKDTGDLSGVDVNGLLPRQVALLPTPNPFHAGNTETPDEWRRRRLDVYQRTGTRHGPALSVVALSVAEGLPLDPDHYMPDDEEDEWQLASSAETTTAPGSSAPTASEEYEPRTSPKSSPNASVGSPTTTNGSGNGSKPCWGKYEAAVIRWEALTRPAPPPTEAAPQGGQRLDPTFTEWMMGLPAGWVTDVPGITRNEALKALGNGVVPQQAAEALRAMSSWAVAV